MTRRLGAFVVILAAVASNAAEGKIPVQRAIAEKQGADTVNGAAKAVAAGVAQTIRIDSGRRITALAKV